MTLEEELRALEQSLLSREIRRDAHALASRISDDFREFGSSGRIYSKTQIMEALQMEALEAEEIAEYIVSDFDVFRLSPENALVTYRASKKLPGGSGFESLRSSIWVFRDSRWQVVFHQGTRI